MGYSLTNGKWKIFRGTIVNPCEENGLTIKENQIIGINSNKIAFVENEDKFQTLLDTYDFEREDIHQLTKTQFLMPGLIDCHTHAPQYPFLGNGMDLPLLTWLERYTFPTEAKFQDLEFAKTVYPQVVKHLISYGTTTAAYFATIYSESSLLLCDIVEEMGQRAYVGKLSQDQNCPEYYVEKPEEAVKEAEKFLQNVLARESVLVTPAISPRFAPACSMNLLEELGKIARTYDVPIQTHLAENKQEIQWVKQLFPQCSTYTEVYKNSNLLTEKTILGHCVHLTDEELEMISDQKSGIAHCPNSNISIFSGILDVDKLNRNKKNPIKIGLGTDLAAGYHAAILNSLNSATDLSKMAQIMNHHQSHNTNHNEGTTWVDLKKAFYLATYGGSKVLGLDEKIGSLTEGKIFDALLVEINAGTIFNIQPSDSVMDMVNKFLCNGDDRNIKEVYVEGRKIKGD